MARKLEIVDFEVTGHGAFPLDMLRHDQCWPIGTNDAVGIGEGVRRRSVRLRTFCPDNITSDRWSSFGWYIVKVTP